MAQEKGKLMKALLACSIGCIVLWVVPVYQQQLMIPVPDAPPGAAVSLAQSPTPILAPSSPAAVSAGVPNSATGNWIKKRDWVIKAHELNKEIQQLALEIEKNRTPFRDKFQAIDSELDAFYKSLGLDQGKLQELFDSVERYLDKKKKKETQGLSTQKEETKDRDFVSKIELVENRIKLLKEDLEQLKLDMKSIEDLDKSLTERIKRVDEQIDLAIQEATKAASNIDALWTVVSDRKAMEEYYNLINIQAKLKSIQSYLKEDLDKDFDGVIETTKKQIAKTRDDTKKLEDKGIIIKDRSKRIEQMKLQELKQLEDAKKIVPIKTKEDIVDVRKTKTKSWFSTIYDYFVIITAKISKFFSDIWQSISSPKPAVKRPLQAPSKTPLTPTQTTTIPSAVPAAATTSTPLPPLPPPAATDPTPMPILPPPAVPASTPMPLAPPPPAPASTSMPVLPLPPPPA